MLEFPARDFRLASIPASVTPAAGGPDASTPAAPVIDGCERTGGMRGATPLDGHESAALSPPKTSRASSSWSGIGAGLVAGHVLRVGAVSRWTGALTRGHVGAGAAAAILGGLLNAGVCGVNFQLERQGQRTWLVAPPPSASAKSLYLIGEVTEPLMPEEVAVAAVKGALVGAMTQRMPHEMMFSALVVTALHAWNGRRDTEEE